MKHVPVSEFKAKCLAMLDEVSRTGEPIVVTRRGVPIAQVGQPNGEPMPKRRLGGLRGTVTIAPGFDLTAPTSEIDDWEWDW